MMLVEDLKCLIRYHLRRVLTNPPAFLREHRSVDHSAMGYRFGPDSKRRNIHGQSVQNASPRPWPGRESRVNLCRCNPQCRLRHFQACRFVHPQVPPGGLLLHWSHAGHLFFTGINTSAISRFSSCPAVSQSVMGIRSPLKHASPLNEKSASEDLTHT
jgi:hypothetical protein